MKYYRTKFIITCRDTDEIPDETTFGTARELCAALAGYAGYESFEDKEYGIDGYIQQETFDEETLTASFSAFPMEDMNIKFETCEAEDKNWNEEWEKEGFDPIIIENKCRIRDIYHKVSDSYPIDVEIDARQAFGTGTHNTTRMIVKQLLNMDIRGKSILDCGCGTGILSIVAIKCGASHAIGYDIDEWSIENTRHNAAINSVEKITAILGNADILDNIQEKFDVVLANINRNILLNDMPRMVCKLREGGTLILSGFYSKDVDMLKEKAKSLKMRFISSDESEDWTLLRFEKNRNEN